MSSFCVLAAGIAFISAVAAQATVLPSYGLWANPACYADPSPLYVQTATSNTLEDCLDFLERSSNFHFGGMADGNLCYGGNIVRQPNNPVDISECNAPCIGNSSEICGGTDRILIYRSGPVIVPSTTLVVGNAHWIGCSVDSTAGRSLVFDSGFGDDPFPTTPQDCVVECSQYGYQLAGLGNGFECYCGNALLNNGVLLPQVGGPCSTGCEGDPQQECGGLDALTVYQIGSGIITQGPGQIVQSYNSWNLLNCYTDTVSSRTLSASVNMHNNAKIETCLDACASQGYSLAGLEFGQECYCGNSIQAPAVVAPSGCDAIQCVGDADQFCGGPDRILVYQHA